MRTRRLKYNIVSGMVNEFIMILCEFILPRQILLYYGSEVNGLVSSITQFLGFIALTEMGVGAVVKSALYQPLATNDETETSRILMSARNFFDKIGRLLILYILLLCAFYPLITRSSFSYAFTVPLIIAISISIVARYYFGIVNLLLLTADQRSYIFLILNSASVIATTVISIILMRVGFGIQTVKFATAVALLVKPVGMALYVNRHYKIDRKVELQGEPIKQKWNGMAQHLATFILNHTDVIVLTAFSTLANVSIYNIYYMVLSGVRSLFTTALTGVDALFGNLYAKQDPELDQHFATYEWLMHTGVTLLFSVTAMLICPFISVYTRGVHDANYILPAFGALLVAAYGAFCIRQPYNTMVMAAGHYKETQESAIIEAGMNVGISVVLVKKFGLYGVAIGTLVAMLYRSSYLAYYLSKAIMHRPIVHYIKHLAVDVVVIGIIVLSTRWLLCDVRNYLEWLVLSAKVSFIATAEVLILNWGLYHQEFQNSFRAFLHRRK